MSPSDDTYVGIIEFSSDVEQIEFKFVLFDDSGNVTWETIGNRILSLSKEGETLSLSDWDTEPSIDVASLPPLEPIGLQEDFLLLRSMVLDVHPGTYRYNDSISIYSELNQLESTFQNTITHQEAYLAISKLLAQLQCDHTFASFFNQGRLMESVIHKQKNKLPFAFEWIKEKMIVTYDATVENELIRGTEIVRINHVPAIDILHALLPYVSVDGATDASRISKLEVEAYDFRYYDFDVFFPLLFGSVSDSLILETLPFGEETTKIIQSESQTLEERVKVLTTRYSEFPKTRNDQWSFEVDTNNVAVLTLNSFGLMGWKKLTLDYKAYLDSVFNVLQEKDVDELIIDIRQNNGGNDEILEELYTYFNIDEIQSEDTEGRTRYTVLPSALKNHIDSWGDPWYYDLTEQKPHMVDGYYIFPDTFKKNFKNKRKKNVFKGRLYLLTSPSNGSLAYYFAKSFKKDELGVIVGEETGGNQQVINGGQILFLHLPYSGIEIDFPVMGEFSKSHRPNKGIEPDIKVIRTQRDIASDIDSAIIAAQILIEK